jgi:hypothetical protein
MFYFRSLTHPIDYCKALRERGEQLASLSTNTDKMMNYSKSFLDAAREYNYRQQNKKWYEF